MGGKDNGNLTKQIQKKPNFLKFSYCISGLFFLPFCSENLFKKKKINIKIRLIFCAAKGAGIFLHELQLYDSFRQKCSKLDIFTA
jgi:hypothetical protein